MNTLKQGGAKMMPGRTIASSLGVAAAAQPAPRVDYVDLDGNLRIAKTILRESSLGAETELRTGVLLMKKKLEQLRYR